MYELNLVNDLENDITLFLFSLNKFPTSLELGFAQRCINQLYLPVAVKSMKWMRPMTRGQLTFKLAHVWCAMVIQIDPLRQKWAGLLRCQKLLKEVRHQEQVWYLLQRESRGNNKLTQYHKHKEYIRLHHITTEISWV